MSTLKICRICLRTGAKMYKFDRFQLLYFYEQVMSLKVNEKDGLPQYFCYECASLLQKFHEFKEKCFRGLIALKKMLWKGQITYKAVDNVDRLSIKLLSPYDVLTVSKRVKTVSTIEKQEIDEIKDEDDDISQKEDNTVSDSDRSYRDEIVEVKKRKVKRKKSLTPDFENDEEHIKDHKEESKSTFFDGDSDKEEEKVKSHKTKSKSRKSLIDKDREKPLRDREAKRKKKSFYESDLEEDFTTECKVKSRESSVSDFGDITLIDNEPAIYVEEKPMHSDTELDITFEDGSKPSSSTTIFVDEKKEIPPKKESKEKVKGTKGPKKTKWNAKNKVLESGNWKKYSLTEQEALEQFRAKAVDPKYIAAPFKCADCFKGFSKEEILKRHRRLHDAAIGNFECRFCRMRFKIDCRLRKHMRAHYTKYECLRCNLICPIELTALLHEELHNGVVKKCEQCNEEFRHRSTYYTHMRTHRSEHVCTLCGASFVSPAGLHQHKKKKHFDSEPEGGGEDEKQTYCKKCDIRFETRAAYTEHLFHSAMHTEGMEDEIRDESCALRKVIGKMSKAKIANELRKRQSEDQPLPRIKLNTRKGRRIFKKPTDCYQCGKHFETQDACLRHHREEHPRTSFYPPSDRQICEICGASLSRSTVAMHLNMHTRETLYSCDVCGRTFHSKGGLKRHMVTHTGEKRYACRLCEKRFTQSGSLSLHYRTFHLKQPYPPRNRRKEIEKPSADAANFLGFYGKEEY
ncbi:zinc finger protein 613-like [Ostrinia furnacalis]|uniref:zinc finger protein 613-like n=2 Tax=Ostrinia TaxID=29056 RepID=UPI00103DD834|nr:zinc finger protein 613-like [Ostrinia furnacalis]